MMVDHDRTAERYFPGQSNLYPAVVELKAAGDAIQLERSPRSGMEFPHLYAVLQQRMMIWNASLRSDQRGKVVVPAVR